MTDSEMFFGELDYMIDDYRERGMQDADIIKVLLEMVENIKFINGVSDD